MIFPDVYTMGSCMGRPRRLHEEDDDLLLRNLDLYGLKRGSRETK